jgi:DNA polymerase-1
MNARPTELPAAGASDVLYLVDLPGYVHRAYHALAPLSSPSGEPTNATYGTLNMLGKLVQQRKPALLGAALEGGANFRGELDPRYKAHRPPPADDLVVQMRRCQELVEAYRIPIFQVRGFEADDVIAAIVKQAKAAGLRVVIASADKDLMQLVDDRCVLWDAMRDRVYGPAEVLEKFGVGPSQVRDLLALVGDASDNVPGVPGIGAKTAAELLRTFGSIDALRSRLGEVTKAKVRESLSTHASELELSIQLVTLRDDAPVTLDAKALEYDGGDVDKLRALFTELGFAQKLAALPREGRTSPTAIATRARVVVERGDLEALAETLRATGRFAIEAVTTSEDAMRCALVGLALATSAGEGVYVPIAHRYLGAPKQLALEEISRVLGPLLADPSVAKIGHDTKRSEVVLRRLGIALGGVAFDTMLASYLADPEAQHELEAVSEREAHATLPRLESLAPKARGKAQSSLDELPVDDVAALVAARVDGCLRIEQRLAPKLESAGVAELLRTLELPLSRVLAQLELGGVLVDLRELEGLGETMGKELARLEQEARTASGHPELNVGSPKQLETILFDELGLKATKKTKTGRSTDAEALEAIADEHELPRIVLDHRGVAKLKGTYVDALPRLVLPATGRIHGHWRQAVAATGRISSEEPNLQNIPIRTELGRQIRKAFVAPPGSVFLSADYSQIELRVLAHLSRDPVMVEAFRTGQDIHTRTAMEIFGVAEEGVTSDMRRKAKTINFGVIYGMGEVALSKRLGISRKEAGDFIEAYFDRYAGVTRFMNETMLEARKTERVRTLLGRIRHLPDLRSTDRVRRAYAERIAQNTPIQGTAADILKLAMVRLSEPVVPGARMVLTVHDELDFEVPAERAEEAAIAIRNTMQSVVSLDVPLVVTVGYGPSWAEAH